MGAVYSAWPLHIPPHQWGCTACHGMSIGHRATVNAAKVMATTGLDLLTEPAFLKAVQNDFVKQLGGREYKTLNDYETSPRGKLEAEDLAHYECVIHAAMEHLETIGQAH